MGKKSFDASQIDNLTPSGGMKPLDFMRPMEGTDAAGASKSPTEPEARATKAYGDTSANELPMPPARELQQPRILVATRLTPELAERVERFHRETNANKQDIAEYAFDEFLARRGY